MSDLIIITPVYRPTNVPVIYHSIQDQVSSDLKITWVVIFDRGCFEDGEIWKVKFTRNNNPNFLIHCMVSEYEMDKYKHRNFVLDYLTEQSDYGQMGDDFVFFLDDNSILHKTMELFLNTTPAEPRLDGYLFDQETSDGRIWDDSSIYGKYKCGDPVAFYKMNAAQMVARLRVLNGTRFHENLDMRVSPDADFIARVYKENKNKFQVLSNILSYNKYLG